MFIQSRFGGGNIGIETVDLTLRSLLSVAMAPEDGCVIVLSLSVSSVPRPVTPGLPANRVFTSSGWFANAAVNVSTIEGDGAIALGSSPRSNRLSDGTPVLIRVPRS